MHHAGGWTVGNLDEFEGAMRIIAEESGHQVSHAAFSMHLAHVTRPSSRVSYLHCTQPAWEHQACCFTRQANAESGWLLLPSGPACLNMHVIFMLC